MDLEPLANLEGPSLPSELSSSSSSPPSVMASSAAIMQWRAVPRRVLEQMKGQAAQSAAVAQLVIEADAPAVLYALRTDWH